jgi:hypothetical protein
MVLTGSQKCKGCSNFFYFHILSVAKFDQIALWNDHHFSYITKMEGGGGGGGGGGPGAGNTD